MSKSLFYAKNDYFCSRFQHLRMTPDQTTTSAFEPIRLRLRENRSVRLTVRSDGMRPFLQKDRDAVVLSPVPADFAFRKGDVVALAHTDGFRLLRVMQAQGKELWLKEDAQEKIEKISAPEIEAWVSCLQCANGRRIRSRSALWKFRSLRSRLFR